MFSGCGNKDSAPSPVQQAVGSAASSSAAPSPAKSAPVPVYFEAVGPELLVAPGRGLSAIRFGTNFEMLERQMGRSCEVRTETRCLFMEQAVDFTMKDGVVSGIKTYRKDRLVPGLAPRVFGIFKGALPPSIQFGLHRHIVAQEIEQKPERTEEIKHGAEGLVAREFYPGLVIEYDRLSNGNVVASTFEVVPLTEEQKKTLGVK